MSTTASTEPSNYIQTLTRYLSNIMNSTLLGLPREIKELIYYDALNHAAERILVSRKTFDSPYHVKGESAHKTFLLGLAPPA